MKKQVVVSLGIPCCAVPTGDKGFFSVSNWKCAIAQRNRAQPLPQTEASCLLRHLHSQEDESSWSFNCGTGLCANTSFPAMSAWDQIDQSLCTCGRFDMFYTC